MKKREWNEGLNHIDDDLVEKFTEERQKYRDKRSSKKIWVRITLLAACVACMIGVIDVISNLWQNGDNNNSIPIVNVQATSGAPQYYGIQGSLGSGGSETEISSTGISVTAKLVETLPDTYTFYDDWSQHEYRLLRMKTVKLLKGKEMTEEFYYMIPIKYMTDYSLFDCFVMLDMAQFTYEHSVVYNKSQGKAEMLTLVVFGYRAYGYTLMGANFMAFDSDGRFDERLWNSTQDWREGTSSSTRKKSISEVEEAEQKVEWESDRFVHLLTDLSKESKDVLSYLKSFENGIYVPFFSNKLSHTLQLSVVRYINGFATNESVDVYQDSHTYSIARFEKKDLQLLPDLSSAIAAVSEAYNNGDIVPPHIQNLDKLKDKHMFYGIFGWYAKTNDGVIGIVRVTWCYQSRNNERDDAYYIVEYGADKCVPIERDDLVKKFGRYETAYIYLGEYNEYGKAKDLIEV